MRQMVWLLVMIAFPSWGYPAWVQYRTSDLQVVGVFVAQADMRVPSGEADLEIPDVTVPNIAWPAPVGCPSGKPEWTQLTAPGTLPLVLNSDLVFFRCIPVADLAELRMVAMTELNRATAANSGLRREITTDVLAVLAFGHNACDGSVTTRCNNIRSKNGTIGARLGTLADIEALQDLIISIFTDFQAVKAAQGW